MLPKVFMGRHATPVITSEVMGGEWSARLQEAQKIGLTTSVWEMAVQCWHRDPAQRPTMTEVVRIVREWPVFFLSPWNKYHDTFPAATGWRLLGELDSRISQPRS